VTAGSLIPPIDVDSIKAWDLDVWPFAGSAADQQDFRLTPRAGFARFLDSSIPTIVVPYLPSIIFVIGWPIVQLTSDNPPLNVEVAYLYDFCWFAAVIMLGLIFYFFRKS
jgi:hypothetical protein